ncbi:hypothetical protein INR49_031205, partial [Caranx melampygus]
MQHHRQCVCLPPETTSITSSCSNNLLGFTSCFTHFTPNTTVVTLVKTATPGFCVTKILNKDQLFCCPVTGLWSVWTGTELWSRTDQSGLVKDHSPGLEQDCDTGLWCPPGIPHLPPPALGPCRPAEDEGNSQPDQT